MADVSAKDQERAKFTFSIYDFEGKDRIDAFYLGDVLRSLDLKPSLKAIEKVGGTKKKGEKTLKFDEFLPIYSQVKKEKDVGNYHEFMEIMKLYDKNHNGTMPVVELTHLLQSLGETLDKSAADDIIKDCALDVDEDGFLSIAPFLKNLLAGPFPNED